MRQAGCDLSFAELVRISWLQHYVTNNNFWSDFVKLYTTKIAWYYNQHNFPTKLSQSTVFNQLVASCVTGLIQSYYTRYVKICHIKTMIST